MLGRRQDAVPEGWFRSSRPAGDGGFVTTEPVGTEDWMPLNDHPSAKPTYDFYGTVNAGQTVRRAREIRDRLDLASSVPAAGHHGPVALLASRIACT